MIFLRFVSSVAYLYTGRIDLASKLMPMKKKIQLQPVPPPMPSESLSVRLSGINSASNGLAEAQVVILYFFRIKYEYIDQSLVCVAYSIHMIHENTLLKSRFLQLGHIAP